MAQILRMIPKLLNNIICLRVSKLFSKELLQYRCMCRFFELTMYTRVLQKAIYSIYLQSSPKISLTFIAQRFYVPAPDWNCQLRMAHLELLLSKDE